MTSSQSGRPAVELRGVSKSYGRAANQVRALDDVSMRLPAGTFTAVMGPSGSGKSTLLLCAAGLETPSDGQVFIDGAGLAGGSETALTKFRRGRIGFVFQQYNLLPTLTVRQNVTLPLRLAGRTVDRRRCADVLAAVGLGDRLDHRPAELSGGQQQRVAIARALVTDPKVIFADEPTGALDSHSAHEILSLLRRAVAAMGQTVAMVTHDPMAASVADTVLFLSDGRLVDRLSSASAEVIAGRMTQLGAHDLPVVR